MAERQAPFSRMAQPFRAFWQRFALLTLIALAFAVMFVGRGDNLFVERFRIAVTDAVTPILGLLSWPSAGIRQAVDSLDDYRDMPARIAALQEENARLRRWRHVAQRLEVENRELREIGNLVAAPPARFVSARVIADGGGPFVRSVLLNAGRRHGARRGLAVLSGEGLVGSVVEVGELHSRVLLVTDLNSQIPVVVHPGREPAVAAGQNSRLLELLYLPRDTRTSTGDRVVTSGHGGVLPPDLPVGVVTAVGGKGIRIKPVVDWTHLDYVRLVDYRLDGVVRAAGTRPPYRVSADDRTVAGETLAPAR